jgi:hypothetical protein
MHKHMKENLDSSNDYEPGQYKNCNKLKDYSALREEMFNNETGFFCDSSWQSNCSEGGQGKLL